MAKRQTLPSEGVSDILKRARLGVTEEANNKLLEAKQNFYLPSGAVAKMTIREAITQFMNENYPEFGERSVSFPEQAVDYGLPTQALVLTDDELNKVAHSLDSKESNKLKKFMKTQVQKGAVSEFEVFNWAKKCENKLLMAVIWSFDQSCSQKLMGTEQRNQEMDVIILLAKQRKFIIIEVTSDNYGKVPSNALKTLTNAKIFADQLFNIVGILESENWEYISFVALPNVKSRDKLHQKAQLHHILTQAELKTDLLKVINLNEGGYEDVSSYKTILSLLAASYAGAVKTSSTSVQFKMKNLVLEASRKLAGKAQIQAGFDPSEEIKDTFSFTELKNEPLAGFKGLMFWNREQVEIL